EPPDHPFIAAVLQGVDDLLSNAIILQGRPRALETEVDVLTLLAYERREGGRQPTTPTDGAAHTGGCIEATAAEYVARPPLTADAALGVSPGTQKSSYDFGRC